MSKLTRSILWIFGACFLVVASLLSMAEVSGKSGTSVKEIQKKLNQEASNGVVVASNESITKVITDINDAPLQDNLDLYQYDDPGSVVTMYLTVRRGNDLENTNHTWAEVNDATKFFFENMQHIEVPKAEAILQVGDETGPLPGEMGYGERVSNATVQIRGSSTSMSEQKSYKLELFDSAGEWRGQRTIALNKHVNEITRARNKLAYDLMKGIPNMVSLRTQFVHLYVKDETAEPASENFQDYGLFTQIELPNQRFLKNHLLDRYGQLYKAIMFEFYRYPEQLRSQDDPQYSEEDFSSVLEIKGNKNHTKLLQMLDDVNNWSIPIETTFEKYFDQDNYFTWMAFNILAANIDTSSQNFYLYSPQNGRKWYFLPWDYDGSFMRIERDSMKRIPFTTREEGISNYWGAVLHQRVLMVPKYREILDAKVREMRDYVTPERVNAMMNEYRPVTDQFVTRMPDLEHLPGTLAEYDKAYSSIPNDMQANYVTYRDSLVRPMPFFMGTPEVIKETDELRFMWGEAYDFRAQDITYHFSIAKNWDFNDLVHDMIMENTNQVKIPMLEPGTYFWRVTATNEDENIQEAFDFYIDSEGMRHSGIKYLYVTSSGTVLERQRELR